MATNPSSVSSKQSKTVVLGRSAATGRFVLAPAHSKKGTVSKRRIEAAVKSALAKSK